MFILVKKEDFYKTRYSMTEVAEPAAARSCSEERKTEERRGREEVKII